jgi:hypothetical protein
MKFLVLIVIAMVLGGTHVCTHSHKDTAGVIIPLYSYPDNNWNNLIHEKRGYEPVPIIAIINPNNGPGIKNPEFVEGIQDLQHAGIMVLGYVPTGYGSRNSSSAVADINAYKNWYKVDGIFFDEMSHSPGFESYYANLTKYTKNLGMTMTVGNPGVDTIPSYIGTVDNIVIHENSSLPSLEFLGGWHSHYDKSNFSMISYDVSSMNSTYVKLASKYVGYIYVTEQSGPNPWEKLSSYFEELLSTLKFDTHVTEQHDAND